jgi:hypothetical protein
MFVSQIIDEASEILGTSDQSKVLRILTQAIQTLMESGHWFHTNAEVDVCTGWDGCTITLPREIEVPLAVNVDGSPTYFRNRFFQYHINKGGMNNPVGWAWDDRGFVATQMDIRQPAQLVAIAESDNDVGKTIRVLGTNQNNVELRDQLPDGTIVDGILLPIHSQKDFALGTIMPERNKVETRQVAVSPLEDFATQDASNHLLKTGEKMVITANTDTIPDGISLNATYYVGVVDAKTIKLYNNQLDAIAGRYPVQLTSIQGAGTITLTDSRLSNVLTQVTLGSSPSITIDQGIEVTFSQSDPMFPLPSPLSASVTYFARSIGNNNLQIYATLLDASQDTNPIYLSGSIYPFNIVLRKPISPQTKLTFSVPHYFVTGDMVQANNNGGSLPVPLVLAQNYYVYVIDPYNVSLHTNYTDSISGTNPIILQTDGSGENSIVKLINASVAIGINNNVKAKLPSIPQPSGSGASVIPVVSGDITSINITNGGSGYSSPPSISFTDVGGANYASAPDVYVTTAAGSGAIFNVTLTDDYVSSVTATTAGSGYVVGEAVDFVGGGGKGAKGHISSVDSNGGITGITLDPVGSGLTASVLFNTISNVVNGVVIQSGGSGYEAPPRATISGGGGSGATASCILTTSFVSRYIVTSGGSLYNNAPAITLSGGGGTGAYGSAVVSNGAIVAVTATAQGSGYTTAPSLTITPSTGAYVTFSSTGTLPSPLKEGVVYRAEQPMTSTSFTLKNIDFSSVNITDTGAGTLYLTLSRAYSVSFTNYWQGDLSGFSTGDAVVVGTDDLLPNTTPSLSTSTPYYLNVNTQKTQAYLYDTQANAIAGGTTGRVVVNDLGTGQTYFGQQISATATTQESIIIPDYLTYLASGTIVRFSSTNGLPAPLDANTNYSIKFKNNGIQVYDSTGTTMVTLTSLGSGQLSMNVVRIMEPVPSTTITADRSLINTGDEIYPRAATGDVLDPSLNPMNAPFFARRVDSTSFELYDTLAHAQNTGSTAGRLSYVLIGNSASSTFYIDQIVAPVFVKRVMHIEKPITDASVSLYAWDYGRSNDTTLIGQYHPSETNPQYRRIRIGKKAAWARILYRVKAPNLTSVYDYIPIEQPRAIIAAVHAIDLENKDFADQALRYWQMAQMYLKSQNESMEGHAMMPPQINNEVYGDGSDWVMF